MARCANTPRDPKNGRVLTAKQLPERTYQTIHRLPYGIRQKIMHKLLSLAVPYAKTKGKDWYIDLIRGKTKIV